MRNALVVLLIDYSGMPEAHEFMPLLLTAFRSWGGQRLYLTNPPQHWLKRSIAQAVLALGGPSTLRRVFALLAKLRRPVDPYEAAFQPAATETDRSDAAFIQKYG